MRGQGRDLFGLYENLNELVAQGAERAVAAGDNHDEDDGDIDMHMSSFIARLANKQTHTKCIQNAFLLWSSAILGSHPVNTRWNFVCLCDSRILVDYYSLP